MPLRDDALNFLRQVFGRERAERAKAESPSAEAEKHIPTSIFSVWGREDVGGLLSVSQNLMDRYADYEQMDDYPDINCLVGDTLIYVVEESIIKPFRVHDLAAHGGGVEILAYDTDKQKLVKIPSENPRVTGNKQLVVEVGFSNGETIKCTPDHKFLTVEHGYINCSDLVEGTTVVSAWNGFSTKGMCTFLHPITGTLTVTQAPIPAGEEDVYDITTSTNNFIANGVVVHNSTHHYFTNDATQPDIDTGKTIWVHSTDEAIKDMTDTLLNKRLRIEDDIWSMVYTTVKMGNCIARGARVWCDGHLEEIQNVKIGQHVSIYKDGESSIGRVEQVHRNGLKEVFRVKTRHREIELTANHPVLVETSDGKREWRKVEDIEVVRYNDRKDGRKGNIDYKRTPKLVTCTKMIAGAEKTWDQVLDRPLKSVLALQGGERGSPHTLSLGEKVEPWFCRLFGFLLGDGFFNVTKTTKQLCIALSRDNHGMNERYEQLVNRLGLTGSRRKAKVWDPVPGCYVTENWDDTAIFSSVRLRNLFVALGWKDGSANKRLPTWVYGLPEEHREELLCGFLDADGWEQEHETWKETGHHFEISNKNLARDLKALIDGLGYRSGNLCERTREPGFLIKGRVVKTTATSYRLGFVKARLDGPFLAETVLSIESIGKVEVFDLGIGDESHNFITDGIVVHNCYEEVLVTENGVVGLNSLPCPTMRRVEQSNGSLIGYVQDITGKFTQDAADLRGMLAGQTKIPDHVALFEEWQVLHARLRGSVRRSPYGFGVADGARWIWKRLVLLEDAMLIYKLCLRGDSQIWTPDGRKAIKDLEEGDEVYSYTKQDELRKTRVVYKKHNGQDTIYRVYSDHREIFANKTHPVLVEEIIGRGSGKPRARVLKYVEVQNLEPGKHRLVTPKKTDWEEIKLKKPELHSKARLLPASQGSLSLTKRCNTRRTQVDCFAVGKAEIKTETAVALLEANGYGQEHLETEEHWGGANGRVVRGVTLPTYVDEDFAQWFGFMLGDGFIITRKQTDGFVATNEVGFALGDKSDINEQYKALFELYAPVKFGNNQNYRPGTYSFVSCKFAEFMLLNGFIPGAHNKRLPEWVFRASPEIKLAMIRGLADADAHIIPRREGRKIRYERARFEMCNEQLLEDVRELAMQLGLVVTMVRSRFREGGRTIKGSTQPLKDTTSYCLDITFKQQPMTEMLRGVEEIGVEDIWDIGVEDKEHNFIADGAVVHNTRAPARFAFYIDVTDIPSDKVDSFLRKAKQDLRKQKMVNPRTQRLDMRFNPMDNMQDFFIAVRENRELARVEVLQGPDYQATEDVDYFARKLHGVLKVPRSYLGQDDAPPPRTILSFEDVRAARVTMGIQREMKNMLRRLIMIDLASRGINPFKQDLQVMMTVPSGIYELAHNEIKNARADFATRVQPFVSMRYIQERILKLSEEEIEVIEKEREEDMKKQAEQQQMMGGDAGGGAGGAAPGGEMPAAGGDPNAQHPGNVEIGPPPGVAGRSDNRTEWKRYDAARRLEERRDRESWKRDAELQDLKQQMKPLLTQLRQHEQFIREFRSTAFARNNSGKLISAPQGRGNGFVPLGGNGRRLGGNGRQR